MQTAAKQNLNYMAKSNAGVKKCQLIFNNVFCKHPKHGSHWTACHYTAYFTNRDSSRTLRNICVRTFWWWGDLCIKAFSICPALQWVCVWVLNPTRKHGRPPNQEGSANKPPVSGWSVVKLLVSCGACISKLKLPVLRTMNCLASLMWRADCSVSATRSSSSTSLPMPALNPLPLRFTQRQSPAGVLWRCCWQFSSHLASFPLLIRDTRLFPVPKQWLHYTSTRMKDDFPMANATSSEIIILNQFSNFPLFCRIVLLQNNLVYGRQNL